MRESQVLSNPVTYCDLLYSIGIGKTTLANEICLKWTNDKDCFLSNDYDLIILIRLRAIQERTLQQAMIEALGSEAAYNELLTKSNGERCLIILEGLDETSTQWQQNDTMFCQLVKNTVFLSHASVLVTSRPHACVHLHEDIKGYTRLIEIVGFDKPQIKEYAELYFCNSDIADKFMEQVNNDPHISSLCYVPLCLNMVLECFKYNNETLHTTFTELCQSFIISKVDDHIHNNDFKKAVSLGKVLKSDEQFLKNLTIVLNDIPNVLSERALQMIFPLSKLAYKSYFEWCECKNHSINLFDDDLLTITERNPKIVYTNKDLAQCNITNSRDACGLLKATNTLFATSNTAVHSFNHLSVQEYFCALYISLLPEDQQLQLLEDHITYYPHVWPFYAGITTLKSCGVLHYLCQFLLWDGQLQEINLFDNPVVAVDHIDNCKITVSLNSIHEAQISSDVCQHGELFSVSITGQTLSPYDCVSISYFMSVAPVTHLLLQCCRLTDQRVEMLTRYNCLPSLKVLNLGGNDITHKGMKSMAKIIKGSTSLTDLVSAGNPIRDDGIKLLLSSNLKHLVKLNVNRTKMTEVSAYDLGEFFKHSSSLQSLEISYNNIKDNGLTGILNNLPSTLVLLNVSDCNLTCIGAVIIGKMLRKNQRLKYLGISKNSIGDDGISAVSDSLHVNTTLIQLVAQNCEFHSKGAESVANMLQVNKTLKYLDISSNCFDENGMTAVTRSIQTNTTLVQLQVFNYIVAGGMAKMLTVNKTLKQLGISCSPDIVPVLNIFCESDCELVQLSIACTTHEEDDSFMKIKNYVDEVNHATTTAVYITCDRQLHTLDDVLQKRCVLKVCLLDYIATYNKTTCFIEA